MSYGKSSSSDDGCIACLVVLLLAIPLSVLAFNPFVVHLAYNVVWRGVFDGAGPAHLTYWQCVLVGLPLALIANMFRSSVSSGK